MSAAEITPAYTPNVACFPMQNPQMLIGRPEPDPHQAVNAEAACDTQTQE